MARKGITNGRDFALFMSGMMSDLMDGSVSPPVANAAVNAGGKLLKVVEMQLKYGKGSALELPLASKNGPTADIES